MKNKIIEKLSTNVCSFVRSQQQQKRTKKNENDNNNDQHDDSFLTPNLTVNDTLRDGSENELKAIIAWWYDCRSKIEDSISDESEEKSEKWKKIRINSNKFSEAEQQSTIYILQKITRHAQNNNNNNNNERSS